MLQPSESWRQLEQQRQELHIGLPQQQPWFPACKLIVLPEACCLWMETPVHKR